MSNIQPIISVIIPVYNVKDYLADCVDSILRQTVRELEIILVDDGSTDGSAELCDAYEKSDERIFVLHQKNAGLGPARNAGLQIAKASWIAFVDSDDYVQNDMYEQLLHAACEQKAAMAVCGYFEVHGTRLERFPRKNIPECLTAKEAIEQSLTEGSFGCFAWNKLYKAELWSNIRFPEPNCAYEDMAIMYRVFEKAARISYLNKPLYYYRQRKGSITHNVSFNRQRFVIFDHYRVLLEHAHAHHYEEDELIQSSVLLQTLRFYALLDGNRKQFAEDRAMLREKARSLKQFLSSDMIPLPKKVLLQMMLWGVPVNMVYSVAKKIKQVFVHG